MTAGQRSQALEEIAMLEECNPSDFVDSGDYEEGLAIVEARIAKLRRQLEEAK